MKELLKLFYIFFKLGLFTFGGGYAMLPQIKEVVVEKEKWIDEDEMLKIIAIAESTPGPVAINMATYIGYLRKKILGSIIATIGVVLPSFIIILIISYFFNKFIDNKYVAAAFVGIKCCVAFLIAKTGIEMIVKMKKKIIPVIMLLVVLISLCVFEIFNLSISSIYFILIGGIVGIVCCAIMSHKNKIKEGEDV